MKKISKLQERAKSFDILLDFMDGREKDDLVNLHDKSVTIDNYGFLPNADGSPYACFTVKEDEKSFYFGGQVLTERLAQLEQEGFKADILAEGLPVHFSKAMSKNKRAYTAVKFYP